jgi:hypothetical protein
MANATPQVMAGTQCPTRFLTTNQDVAHTLAAFRRPGCGQEISESRAIQHGGVNFARDELPISLLADEFATFHHDLAA